MVSNMNCVYFSIRDDSFTESFYLNYYLTSLVKFGTRERKTVRELQHRIEEGGRNYLKTLET